MMKTFFKALIFAYCFGAIPLLALTDFDKAFYASDPITNRDSLSVNQVIDLYEDHLESVLVTKDTTLIFYAYLFLVQEYLYEIQDFPKALEYIIKSEKLALASSNVLWQGVAHFRRGSLHAYLKEYEESISAFKVAVKYCGVALDSQYVGKSYEQIATGYRYLNNFEQAHEYYERGISLIEKYCEERNLAVAYSNYAFLLSAEGNISTAIDYHYKALEIGKKINDKDQEIFSMISLGREFLDLDRLDEALQLFSQCISVSKENVWMEYLMYSYEGISEVYEKKQDTQNALVYYKLFHQVNNSISGLEVKKEIAGLNIKYESQKKKLALEKNKVKLTKTQQSLERSAGALFFTLLLLSSIIIIWRIRTLKNRQDLLKSEDNLKNITQILLEKNTRLSSLEEELLSLTISKNKALRSKEKTLLEENLFSQKILTDRDWTSFKSNFEKTYPGFIHNLRIKYPSITEAEERLFLFIKLQLNSKEIANMLGISLSTVKKTRYRVRKRLALAEETSLETYIRSF